MPRSKSGKSDKPKFACNVVISRVVNYLGLRSGSMILDKAIEEKSIVPNFDVWDVRRWNESDRRFTMVRKCGRDISCSLDDKVEFQSNFTGSDNPTLDTVLLSWMWRKALIHPIDQNWWKDFLMKSEDVGHDVWLKSGKRYNYLSLKCPPLGDCYVFRARVTSISDRCYVLVINPIGNILELIDSKLGSAVSADELPARRLPSQPCASEGTEREAEFDL